MDIIVLVDTIITAVDTDDIVIEVFLDLKKAFDIMDHIIVYGKLFAYGIRGKYWNGSLVIYKNISQYVVFGGFKADLKKM